VVVLLHGFASSRRSWERVAALLDAETDSPDSRGHGAAAAARPVTAEACVADIAAGAPERFTLCGYSLGGRLALHAALALGAERVERLVLVSASAGIEDEAERAARRAADEELAQLLESDGLAAFAARWRELPLFAGDPEWVRDEVEAEQLRADPAGLAAALRGLGAGTLPAVWGRLGELAMPLTVLAGERDRRYVDLAARLGAPDTVIVPGAGHRLQLEVPQAVAEALRRPSGTSVR
jgi:2-succinyl-6-hydroxy-2,4-cyclohexadiene-1-carboxylate synthase